MHFRLATTHRLILLGVMALSMGRRAHAAAEPGLVAVFGVGQIGPWTTQINVANSEGAPVTIGWTLAPDQICPPLNECHTIVDLPSHGSVTLGAPPNSLGFLGVGYVATSSLSAPSVHARVYEIAGTRSVDLPVYRVATLLAMNPSALSFPGATRKANQRCNLLIGSVVDPATGSGSTLDLTVNAIDATGNVAGSRSLHLEDGESLFLSDVLASLGVDELDEGQVLVTKNGGDGVMWGIMPIVRADGSLSVSTGVVP